MGIHVIAICKKEEVELQDPIAEIVELLILLVVLDMQLMATLVNAT